VTLEDAEFQAARIAKAGYPLHDQEAVRLARALLTVLPVVRAAVDWRETKGDGCAELLLLEAIDTARSAMALSIVTDILWWNECPRCQGDRGRNEPGGFCETCCATGEVAEELSELATFAHNLAIGAALCEAHYRALDEAEDHRLYHEHGYRMETCWSPGCQRSAP
jgi:hypothetical protein